MALTLSLAAPDHAHNPHAEWLEEITDLKQVIDASKCDDEIAALAEPFIEACDKAIETRPTTIAGVAATIECLLKSERYGDPEQTESVLNGVLAVLKGAAEAEPVATDRPGLTPRPGVGHAVVAPDPHMGWEAERKALVAQYKTMDESVDGHQEQLDELCQRERDLIELIQTTPAQTAEGALCQIEAPDKAEIDLGAPYRDPQGLSARQMAVATIRQCLSHQCLPHAKQAA